jgi:hypothetical protein
MRAVSAVSLAIVGLLGVVSTAHATDVSQPQPGLTLAQTAGDALVVADLCADGVSVRATR